MGNDSSKGKKSNSNNNTLPSSKSSDNDSSEWNRVSPPSSPDNLLANSSGHANFITIEDLSKSTVLVENPKQQKKQSSNMAGMNSPVVGLTSAFTATTQGGNDDNNSSTNRRRIVKATPPRSGSPPVSTTPVKQAPSEDDHPHSKQHHLPAVLSPKASTELLEESMEQSKTKRLEKLSRDQKSKRTQKLNERRKNNNTGNDSQKKETTQANPFSKFLKIFSVDAAYPEHKRPYEEGDVDREEVEADKAAGKAKDGRNSPLQSKRQKLDDSERSDEENEESIQATIAKIIEGAPEWVPVAAGAAAVAAIAVMLVVRITGSNK